MSRFPLLMLLSILLLAGCSAQSGSGSSSGGGGSSTSSSSGSSSGGGGDVDPDPSVFPSAGNSDQNSFDVSTDVHNPRARNFNGTKVTLTAFLADQLGNNLTIEDGTPVFWASAGGSIQPMCTTTAGTCTVEWTSQNPRPSAGPTIADPLGSADTIRSFSSARASILAWTLGTESFDDNNSNGLFDDDGVDPDSQVDDLPEAFIDKNENGTRDVNEEFVNYPLTGLGVGGGTYDLADGLYSGANCAHATLCSPNQTVFNFMNVELAMSSDSICIVDVDFNAGGYWETVDYDLAAPVDLKNDRDSFSFLIHDCFGNPPISGTSVEIASSVGEETFSDAGPIEDTNVDMGFAVTGSLAPTRERYPLDSMVFSASVLEETDNTDPETGTLTVTVTSEVRTVTRFLQLLDPAL